MKITPTAQPLKGTTRGDKSGENAFKSFNLYQIRFKLLEKQKATR